VVKISSKKGGGQVDSLLSYYKKGMDILEKQKKNEISNNIDFSIYNSSGV
jgi:hypothetical protein